MRRPPALLRRIFRNLSVDAARRRTRERASLLSAPEAEATHELAPDAERVIAAREELRIVIAAVAELPPRCRQCFVMRRFDDLDQHQIARRMTEHATMAALAADVLSVAPPRFALAGLSMGRIVAMEVLRQASERVERLALLDTTPLAEATKVAARRPEQIVRAEAGDLAGLMREELKPNYLAGGPDDAGILDLCMAMALGLGAGVFARQSRALATRPDQTATLAAFAGPALVLMGEADRLCPRDRHDLMHGLLPKSRIVVVAGAGHLPTLEQPHATTAALAAWLQA